MNAITIYYTDGTIESFNLSDTYDASRDSEGITITAVVTNTIPDQFKVEEVRTVTFVPHTSIKKIVQTA